MKNILFSSALVLTLLFLTTGTAFAADGLVQLIAVRSDSGVPTFVFRVNEQLSQSELKGFVHMDGGSDYGLHCAQQDETTVVCHTSKAVSGKNVVIGFAGARFWSFVPEYTPQQVVGSSVSEYCHTVYDYKNKFETNSGWVAWVEHCQSTEPKYNDWIMLSGAPSHGGSAFQFQPAGVNYGGGGVTPGIGWYQ